MPRLRRCGGTSLTSAPFSEIVPAVRVSNPAMRFRVVVLPDPLGPRSVMNSPGSIVNEMSSTAGAASP
jgi:hypothetical protein